MCLCPNQTVQRTWEGPTYSFVSDNRDEHRNDADRSDAQIRYDRVIRRQPGKTFLTVSLVQDLFLLILAVVIFVATIINPLVSSSRFLKLTSGS